MQFDILVPTCKPAHRLEKFISDLLATSYAGADDLIVTSKQVSAACNRNYALHFATAPYVIMLDDDITGFYQGWDIELLKILENSNGDFSMVSARLMNNDGTPATMMNITPDLTGPLQYVSPGYLPSACIAFRNDGLRFDENFEGSSWEDTDFCDTLHKQYPEGKFVIANSVRLVHANEMKNGNSNQFHINKAYYQQKHGRVV